MQLEDFMQIKEKAKANNSVKDEFKSEFEAYLNENGINEKSSEYAICCMSLGGPEVINKWVNKFEPVEVKDKLSQLYKSGSFVNTKNRYLACSFAVRMIGLNSGVNRNQIAVEESIKVIPIFAYNGDGKLNNAFTKIIKNHLMGTLAIHISFIPLDKMDIEQSLIKSFSKLVNNAAMELISTKLNENDKRKANLILEWVAPFCVNASDNTKSEHVSDDSNGKIEEQKKDSKKAEELEKKVEEKAYSKLVSSIFDLAESVQNLEDNITQFNKQKALMTAALKDKEKVIEELNRKLDDAKNEIEKLNSEKQRLLNDIENKEQSISSLDEDVQKRDQMIEFQQREKVASESEKLNRIASDLKMYYDEYMEAKNMELSSDIAGVLIDDLDCIFRVLKKNGIEIK